MGFHIITAMPERLAKRLLLVGWDAADWDVIDPLMARGAMPNLKRLVDGGVRADLHTLEPKLSPMLWTTIATGKHADKHGILNFVEPNADGTGIRIVASTTRKVKALWNILTQAGLRVHALAWYASQPAEPISGVCVSNLFREGQPADPSAPWPLWPGSIHASHSTAERIAVCRHHPAALARAELKTLLPGLDLVPASDTRPAELAARWSQALAVHGAALEVMSADRSAGQAWDCMMVFHESIDTIGHRFMELRPPRMPHVSKDQLKLYGRVMDSLYMRHDQLLGELLHAAGPDTSVILVSDHGFHSGDTRPIDHGLKEEAGAVQETRWHRSQGVIVLSGPGFRSGERIAAPSVLDITPTALVALGVPAGADMDGRVIVEAFANAPAVSVVASWDTEQGESGLHPQDLRQDPYDAVDALKQLVDLGYMPSFTDGQAQPIDTARQESKCNLGVVYMTTHRHAMAVPIFRELVAAKPTEHRFVLPLAQCQQAIGDWAGCIETLKAYLDLGTDFVDARILLAHALACVGEDQAADAHINRLVTEEGSHPEMALSLGQLLASRQRWQEAEQFMARARSHQPKDPNVCVASARLALQQGKHDQAMEHCLDATEIAMALPEAHYLLGVALAWMGELEHAMQSLQNATAMQPGNIEAQRFLVAVAAAAQRSAISQTAQARVSELEAKARAAGSPEPAPAVFGAAAWRERTISPQNHGNRA